MKKQNEMCWFGKPIEEWPSFSRKEVYSIPDRLIKIINSMGLPSCLFKNNVLIPGIRILKKIEKGKRGQVFVHIENMEHEKRSLTNETSIKLDKETSLGLPLFGLRQRATP